MQKFIGDANRQREQLRLAPWQLRIGIKTGSVIAGVVGTRRFPYDVWGNTVNLPQRLEETCEPGRVDVSGSTPHRFLALFETERRGTVALKHMDALEMDFLDRIKPELAAAAAGCLPYERLWQASGLG